MDEFINIIKQLRIEGVIKWVVILRPFSDEITFILHLCNDVELQVNKQDFDNNCMIRIYDNIKEFGGLNENKEKQE